MKRIRIFVAVLLAGFALTGCFAPMLVAGASTRLLLALLKPMVGLDPHQTGLFEQPVIKERMEGFLGPRYEPTMQLLATADRVQQEGPLFYVVSRYTPVPQFAEKAGFVWNSQSNQMAVMLITGGSPTVLAENLVAQRAQQYAQNQTQTAVQQGAAAAVPQWPTELQGYLTAAQNPAALQQKALGAAVNAVANPAQTVPAVIATPPSQTAEPSAAEVSAEKPVVEKPAVEKPAAEKPPEQTIAAEKAVEEKATADKATQDKTEAHKAVENLPEQMPAQPPAGNSAPPAN